MSTPRLIATDIRELLPMARTGDESAHVSSIIRSICIRLGHFEDDDPTMTDADRATRQTRWELGSAFEEAVRTGLARRYERDDPDRYVVPGELELDGLIGSPDLIDLTDDAIIEIKLTWLSSRHDPEGEKFWKYWVQGMAYAKMYGTRKVQLHACHVMGDYRQNRDPTYNIWERLCDQVEIDNNWRMLRRHQLVMKA